MNDLLQTKLAPPAPRTALIARDELFARLDAGREGKLTLLSAPAGYGKTTLVAQWLAERDVASAWVALDWRDNDPARFWRYIVGACQSYGSTIGNATLTTLNGGRPPSFEALLTALINDLAALPERAVLVLEDYHLITTPQIHEGIAFLLEHLPTMLHVIVITRSDPPLPLARLRAVGDLVELRASDLRFSESEAARFLQQALPFAVVSDEIRYLQQRTEGWPAGMRLASLALSARSAARDRSDLLEAFTGSHRHILAYLVADVLQTQPEHIQDFLLLTSGLRRLHASLCDAMTERSDSASVLNMLEQANLFLTPLDDQQQWYRYHALFAEAMQQEARQRLGSERLTTVMRTASVWYDAHGLHSEAVEAALGAHEWERAAVLIERIIARSHMPQEIYTLRRWLETLPSSELHAHAALCFTYATTLLFTEDRRDPAILSRIGEPLQLAETLWRGEDNQERLGEALALRSMVAWWQGDSAHAFAAARRALALIPDSNTIWRGTCLLNVAVEELYAGNLSAAQRALNDARERSAAVGNRYAVRAAISGLGEVCVQRGSLHEADRLFAQVLAEAQDDPVDRGYGLITRAALAYEWNDMQAAQAGVDEAFAVGQQCAPRIGQHYVEAAIFGPATLLQARILHARGEKAQAQEALHSLFAQARLPASDVLYRELRALQARLALAVGNLDAVQTWTMSVAQRSDELPLAQQEREALLVARLLLAQGDANAALRALERWLALARDQGRIRSELMILVLVALARTALGEHSQAQQLLQNVLGRAQPEGYRRLFLDEGAPLAALLVATLPQLSGATRLYAENLRSEFEIHLVRAISSTNAQEPNALAALSLVEPLSPQEQRVLRLLAAGLSNPEIAQELVVSVNTVKTQVQSIFRKLDVSSRKQAAAVAQALGLR